VIKDPTTPKTRRYTTLRNIGLSKIELTNSTPTIKHIHRQSFVKSQSMLG